MKLYYHPISTSSLIVMMFAAQEGIPLELQLIDLMNGEQRKPDYKALNPVGLVPMLEDDGFRLTESGAIIRYLAGKIGSAAYPTDLKKRARVDEIMQWFYSNFYKDLAIGMVYPQLLPHHKRQTDEVQAGTIEWGKTKAENWLGILDKDIIGPSHKLLCGEQITLADYVGAEMVKMGELVGCEYRKFPNVCRWLNNMKGLKHWGKVHEAVEGFAASLKGKQFVAI